MQCSAKQIQDLELYLWVKHFQSDLEKKYIKKIQKLCVFFKYIPGLLMLWVGNSIAMKAWNDSSDIDVFVVTDKNSLWFVRIVLTCIVQILGQRKTQKKHAGKICLSFFCTQDVLDLSKIAIKDDIYLYYRILTMKPIITKGDIYEKFVSENKWVDFKKFHEIHKKSHEFLSYSSSTVWSDKRWIKCLDIFLRKIFLPRTLKQYEELWKPFWVIISDTMLKFHDEDKREYITKKVLEKI